MDENGLCIRKQARQKPLLSTKFNAPWHQSQQHTQNECTVCSFKQQRECRNYVHQMPKKGDIKRVKRMEITVKPVNVVGTLINSSGHWQSGFRMVAKIPPKKGMFIQRIDYPRIR